MASKLEEGGGGEGLRGRATKKELIFFAASLNNLDHIPDGSEHGGEGEQRGHGHCYPSRY